MEDQMEAYGKMLGVPSEVALGNHSCYTVAGFDRRGSSHSGPAHLVPPAMLQAL